MQKLEVDLNAGGWVFDESLWGTLILYHLRNHSISSLGENNKICLPRSWLETWEFECEMWVEQAACQWRVVESAVAAWLAWNVDFTGHQSLLDANR